LKSASADERRLLGDIAEIAMRLKRLRVAPTGVDRVQINALEQQSRMKWSELRLLRAGPPPFGPDELGVRRLYR
jgi:hypothetical protein